MSDLIRWGILGTGKIARQFAAALKTVPNARLTAVGSRFKENALTFAGQFGVRTWFDDYEKLVQSKEIDVVYVATPHSSHQENALLALQAGKAVLCEKPFTINETEARQVVQLARRKKLFLMEAMWTRFFPLMGKLRELLQAGTIGEPRMLMADFGYRADFQKDDRLFDPRFGGGALLDVGVYTVSLASMIFGKPKAVAGLAHIGKTGVDEESAFVLKHGRGQLALLGCATRTDTPEEATILGTEGRIRIHSHWWRPTAMTIRHYGSHEESVKLPLEGNGYQYEALEVMRCLRQNELESPIMPLDETLNIMKSLDAIRAQWGLRYPMEKAAQPKRSPAKKR